MERGTFLPKCEQRDVLVWDHECQIIRKIPGYLANVNPDTNQVYSVRSKIFKPVDYKDSLDIVQAALDNDPITAENEFKGYELLSGGGKMMAKWSFPVYRVHIGDRADGIIPTMTLKTAYDGNWSWFPEIGAYSFICANGMKIGKSIATFKHRHTVGLNRDLIQTAIKNLVYVFTQETEVWEQWTTQVLDEAEKSRILTTMDLGKKDMAKLEAEAEIRTLQTIRDINTVWIFYQIMTQFITHKMKGIKRDRMSNRLNGAMHPLRTMGT